MPWRVRRMNGSRGKVNSVPWYLYGSVPLGNCVIAYQPKGAANLAASYVNLANPGTYNATPGTAPTWNATDGWIFLTTSAQYLKTGVTAGKAGWSLLARYSNFSNSNTVLLGGDVWSDSGFGLIPNYNDTLYYTYGISKFKAQIETAGVMAIAGTVGYFNGVSAVTELVGSSASASEIFIGGDGEAGALNHATSAYLQAFALYNITLTAAQVLAISTAMAAL